MPGQHPCLKFIPPHLMVQNSDKLEKKEYRRYYARKSSFGKLLGNPI
jgi:hypothetical protein